MRRLWSFAPLLTAGLTSFGTLSLAQEHPQVPLVPDDGDAITKLHEPGRCAFRGHCGKQSFLGGELPCVDNELASEPDDAVRSKLVDLCGPDWATGLVCCDEDQVRSARRQGTCRNRFICLDRACQ
jgi:Niemann-Pick C1 protein